MELVKKLSKELPFLKEIDQLKKEVDKARPLGNTLENIVLQKLRLDWNYNTNAIEGNSFTYGETVALLMEGITVKGKPFKDAMDIKGHDSAIDIMMSIVKNDRELIEADIRNLHKILLVESYYSPAITSEGLETRKLIRIGEYKSSPNHVITSTGATHYYTTPEDTPLRMRELVDWYNNIIKTDDFHPIVLAALFHHRFVSIHPFDDGNGRMTRLLTNLILLKYGYPISVIKNETKQDYYVRLSQADNGEVIPIIELIAATVKDSLDVYIKAIAIFKLKLDVSMEQVKERDSALMVNVAFEIFSHLKSKLDKFAYLFQSNQEIIRDKRGGTSSALVTNQFETLTLFKESYEKSIHRNNSVSYLYILQKDLKGNGTNVSSELEIKYLNKTYEVNFQGNKVTKLYGDKILNSEIVKLIEIIARYYMKSIKAIYEHEQKKS